METKLTRLSRGYAAALRKYLKQGPRASLQPARGLGRKAMAFGLEALDLARIHEQALVSLSRPRASEGIPKWAERFFSEAIAPIETAQRVDREAKALVNRRNDAADLAASKRCLKQGIVQRKAVEKALKKSKEHFTRLLEKSCQLQEHLRHQTHRAISAQEDERRVISRDLHDEVAQTLLGINVRLLMLKNVASVNPENFKKEIASAQRLVGKSIQSINQVAHDLKIHHQG